MKIVSIGGGPAGLYFGILMMKADARHDVLVLERNRADDTFGFGVVFSDATLDTIAEADRPTYDAITKAFFHWDDIDIHYRGQVLRSTGHGFSGCSRKTLLNILQSRAAELGVRLEYQREVTDIPKADLVLAADGVGSFVRAKYAEHFKPSIDLRPNRFVWLGTTFPFTAFTFYFRENEHGLWRVHAYRYDKEHSTFIVETTEDAWKRSGMDKASEDETIAFCEKLFAKELAGHRLLKNRSLWRSFPIVKNARWYHENVVLMGDAAHTAHFSIGSGTKLAMEDSIALRDALAARKDVHEALALYEGTRKPQVESWQRAAHVSLQWFEDTERYMRLEPIQFGFSLLTRSLRVTHQVLKQRDPAYVKTVDEWVAGKPGVPPMFTPFKLRDMTLTNRVVVSPMCQYSADDGTPNDWHFSHLTSRAIGGAGLVISEMTDVSRDARISPGCTGMYKDEHVVAWKRIVDWVHTHTTAKIGMQLAHAGRKGATSIPWAGGYDEPLKQAAWPILSASPIAFHPHGQVPREMTRDDMTQVRDDFVQAALRAERAGFDMVELHFAHGYLLSTFLSPLTNVRKDEFGGSPSNRLRYPLEVFDAVRAAWPARKPMSVRISATDWAAGGFEPKDAVEVAKALKAHGCDIIDVSAGNVVAHGQPVYGRLFQTPFSERVRMEAGIPTMTVGNISSWSDVNSIIAAGRADLAVLARAHLYDPYWTRHAATEQGYELPWPNPYASLTGYKPK